MQGTSLFLKVAEEILYNPVALACSLIKADNLDD